TWVMSSEKLCPPAWKVTNSASAGRVSGVCIGLSCSGGGGTGGAGRGQRIGVEDQRDLAVAQNGGGRDAGDGAVVRVQPLDHHLALVLHRIDHQRTLALAFGLDQQQQRRLAGI